MTLSIRTKLTVWYVILLTVSLVAFGSLFTYSYFKVSLNRIDNQISSVANMMPHSIMDPSGHLLLPKNFDVLLERFFGLRSSGNYIQVREQHGEVVVKSSNLKDFTLPVSKETLIAAHSGLTTFEVVRTVGRHPVRVVTKPVHVKDVGLGAIIQVGYSMADTQAVLNSLIYIFGFGILASIVIASAIGWFLAKKALTPVASITDMARRIGAENLDERIEITGPQDEIGRLAATINEMIERLETSFERIRQFTGDASHELKTPLTVLKGEMEMALRSGDDVEYMREVLASGLEEIDRMALIVRNLLDLARIDVEKGRAGTTKVAINEIVTERFDHFRRLALDTHVDLVILRNEPARVMGDPVRVGQLVFNLVENAIKYTPEHGRVELSVGEERGVAVIKITDTGVGIAEEDIPYLFDRFFRVDKARTSGTGGAGLGLSICHEIVVSMGGEIDVRSRLGHGTTFTVRIPAAGGAG